MVLCCVYGLFCVLFVACFVALIGRILWLVEKGLFCEMVLGQNDVYWSCKRALWHAIASLGSKFHPSGMQLRGFPRNCVSPTHFQNSYFKRPYLSRPNSDLHVLGLYEKIFDTRCNAPKYTLVVFDMLRVFCKPNLNVS